MTTAGLVRACVTHPDGTFHLMLSGLQRARITGWEKENPFRLATVEVAPSYVEDESYVKASALELVDLCGRLCGEGKPMSDQLRHHLRAVKDPAAISDVVAKAFID